MKEIKTIGEQVLKEIAKEVPIEKIQEKLDLINEMIEIMRCSKGVGIAAPQIGVLEQIVIIEIQENERYPNIEKMPLTIMINPKLNIIDEEKVDGYEGCLSVPGVRGVVPRYKWIQVEYLDEKGQQHTMMLDGFPAKVAQHEVDHLNGIVFLERVEDKRSFITNENYFKYILSNSH